MQIVRSQKWNKQIEEPIRERDSDMYFRRCRIRYASRSNQFLKCVISVSCHEPHTKQTGGKPAAYQQRHCHMIASLHGASPAETPIWCGALLQGAQTWLPSLTIPERNSAEKRIESRCHRHAEHDRGLEAAARRRRRQKWAVNRREKWPFGDRERRGKGGQRGLGQN